MLHLFSEVLLPECQRGSPPYGRLDGLRHEFHEHVEPAAAHARQMDHQRPRSPLQRLVAARRPPSAHLPAPSGANQVRANRWWHMLADGLHRPTLCRRDENQLSNAGPEQPRIGGERPWPPPALLQKRWMLSRLNAAAVDPKSRAHAALRCPSLSMLEPSCWQAQCSLRDQMRRWPSAESAENALFAFLHARELFTRPSQSPLASISEKPRL